MGCRPWLLPASQRCQLGSKPPEGQPRAEFSWGPRLRWGARHRPPHTPALSCCPSASRRDLLGPHFQGPEAPCPAVVSPSPLEGKPRVTAGARRVRPRPASARSPPAPPPRLPRVRAEPCQLAGVSDRCPHYPRSLAAGGAL